MLKKKKLFNGQKLCYPHAYTHGSLSFRVSDHLKLTASITVETTFRIVLHGWPFIKIAAMKYFIPAHSPFQLLYFFAIWMYNPSDAWIDGKSRKVQHIITYTLITETMPPPPPGETAGEVGELGVSIIQTKCDNEFISGSWQHSSLWHTQLYKNIPIYWAK